ncbi:MAG: TIGR02206 family membrane protein [Chloroflexota bacterium]
MAEYFDKFYSGAPFELFGPAHLTALGIVTLVCLSFVYFRRMWGEGEQKIFRYTVATLLIINELGLHAWIAYWGLWNIQTMLPLHMCSVFVWLTGYMLYTRNYRIYELAYFLGIGGAMQALLTPDAGPYGFPHYRAFQTFFAHGVLFMVPIYMTVVEGFRPTLASLKRVFIWTNIYMVPVFFLNLAIGSNYLFIGYKPDFPTLLDALAPWPWYIPELEIIGLAILSTLYIPFLIKDWLASRQAAVA